MNDSILTKKEIFLVPDPPLSNRLEITVMDFPGGLPESRDFDALREAARKRCKISVEYGRPDVLQLKDQGLDFDAALDHYKNHIYELVRFRILSHWEPVTDIQEILDIIKERLRIYYE